MGNAFSGYLTLEKINREYGEDDTQLRLGIIYSFGNGERHTKLPTLFANNTQKDTLSLSQLSPISSVNYDNFAISPRKTTYIEHIARVDKTALGAGDGIGLNSDGTLASIYFDNGGFTVTSIDSVNDSTYMPYLGIEGGKLALVNIMALNAHMKAQGLTTGQTKTLNIAVSDTSGSGISLYSITITKGSVQLNATAQKAHNATALQRTAFLAGTQTIAQINTANAGGQVPPVMGDVPNQNATSGTAYSLNVSTFTTLTNADPISAYTLTGALPTGVTFDSGTGLLSGTPTQTGTFNLSVTATDNDGVSNNDAFTLTVAAANTIPVLS